MRVTVFSAKPYDEEFLKAANEGRHDLVFTEAPLHAPTAKLAAGSKAVCAFVNDDLGASTLTELKEAGVKLVALRCAGFNRLDLTTADHLQMATARVPSYSPYAIAEHTLALVMTLNRKIHRAYNRVREGNFALNGLLGFDLHGKTVGVVGTGGIGRNVMRAFSGFGCKILAFDPYPSDEAIALGARYVDKGELLERSEIITLHCPLTPETRHFIDEDAIAAMQRCRMLVNTSRGGVIDTLAVIEGLKSGRIGALALDVYEEEEDLFFRDLSSTVIRDDIFARLLTFPNVLITGHQGFFTEEALYNIAHTTIGNITAFEEKGAALHPIDRR
ncbi:2-hydroxyacid dehydrogenase [Martelella sp. AD-3]|uniref:2-hydroxyacid dehydrogenase n=1 Tax=Martelella sp. AD-3 TaxID=686597 RepID=UPI000465605B|nr:2-hydroxyacid dehydrogenase [Martelella sp. AD-3]AMM85321.1 hydroxyacid dehydrogenase [Martelella sp. AD-3]MAM13936.1 2-hydroxyacid dehydrogenase [Rhizobiaceae bacterium]|tara:strand:- start:165 stop:1157 length:993 start_codon:yes stop_codon:yes gene_type:complete